MKKKLDIQEFQVVTNVFVGIVVIHVKNVENEHSMLKLVLLILMSGLEEMKIYSGNKNPKEPGPATVIVEDEEKGEAGILDPTISQQIINHSPDGFQWGYGGSGPCQLGLALLIDLGVADWAAEAIYHKFTLEVVAMLPPKWTRSETELRLVIDRLMKERER